ncbi:FMN adenylyltransferase [Gallibacterium salpingitidis]|uniref:Riboflavin biosynthesis protein n=1 Tax=Gallibacterium salpingitidis TaxID=505341 RepID=A0A1A7QAP8_9PAST|nr:bifunctional riboflavin kinase/FAD synthetase [Gallibacterium salpingitidis]OBW94152.1 FMN adenylyltransferase [Gallibacterium salpingitidis]OBX09149.1 FMN adenylyltransferase [Gallibacterium salpingitidis]OBX10962.1 FMN adenylyltransferase [Gallibacterium salpingitidis]WKS99660.1 bifunctional riboflavin kinase/FAD synthetase [Gallibacterium salpingitidis]
MQLIRGLYNLPTFPQGCALTIGNFDGVHLGHQTILRHLKQQAEQLALPAVVMLFEPQAKEFFLKEKAPARLMRLRDKLTYLARFGVDYVFCVPFNLAFAQQTTDQFIQHYLIDKLKVKFLSVGDDFRFGVNRSGNFETLAAAGKQYGFQVENNTSYCLDSLRVSSTAIRQALAEDKLDQVEQMLGRAYSILGRVVHGNELGRTIGFPTANIRLHRQVNPLQGVYAVEVMDKRGNHYYGVANVGNRPTINGMKPLLEVHLFDFNGDLYGKTLEIFFKSKLRSETKFPSFDALRQQIARDVENAKKYFQQNDEK